MLKEEKTICSRYLWFGLSHRKSHPFPEPIAFRPGSFVKRSQVSWPLVLGFLAVERGCIQRSSALGLFGFHRAIKRVTETLRCCGRLLRENEWIPRTASSRNVELECPAFNLTMPILPLHNSHLTPKNAAHITLSRLQRIHGIFDNFYIDHVKNVVVRGLKRKTIQYFCSCTILK